MKLTSKIYSHIKIKYVENQMLMELFLGERVG